MTTIFTAKINALPAGVTEKRFITLLSSKCKVVSIQMSRTSCTVQLESADLLARLERSTTGTMGFNSFLNMDSSGLGELKTSTISLVQ